ncbi:MAG TPA: HAMP domain-containing sensor histidine kinase [Cytophaga sp.]|jgi:signal transduction histidine kinase|nr:HAMP domain-containing sensor histidine kinase [Cytophaga sp.]
MTDYTLLGNDPATNAYEYKFNYISTTLFCVLFFYVILRVNQYINTKLSELNKKFRLKNNSLKKVNEELDSYVYRTSRDMRSPLTSLMGLIHLVKTEKDLDKIEQLMSMQENCVNKLDTHIQQIIHLSKNIKTQSYLQPINFRSMLNNIFEELSFFAQANNVYKVIRIEGIAEFYSDTYRIQTILSNLISNSFKYYRISDERSTIEIDIHVQLKSTTIIIKDNGIGIPEEKMTNIFDMFYRGTNQSKGSGLGLYIVKEMVEKLNGTISVKSRVNVYTQFMIELPNK